MLPLEWSAGMASVTIDGQAPQILPLAGEVSPEATEGEVPLNQCGVPPPASGRLPLQGEDLAGITAIFTTAFRPDAYSWCPRRRGRALGSGPKRRWGWS